MRIEFCGGIGVGKTSCATTLATRWSLPLVSERFEAVSYWTLFAQDSTAHAFEKDLSFLLSHAEGIRMTRDLPAVCDFALFQTISYSAVAGNIADTEAVRRVYGRLAAHIRPPSLVVRLRCSVEVQLDRIRVRDRAPERGLTQAYLERLDVAIDQDIRDLPDYVHVIDVDTSAGEASEITKHPLIEDHMKLILGPETH